MKYCYQCGKMTPGDPLYCTSCGRTYDLKLCPRHHPNPRGVDVCAKCGSRDLSTPQPRIPMSIRLFALLVRLGLGLLLFYASLSLVIALFNSSQVRQFFVAFGILMAILWGLWAKLPDWFQETIRSFWVQRSQRDDE